MKYSFVTLLLILIVFAAFSQLPAFEWAIQCGNPPNTTDTKTTLASGPDGSFYLSGEFLDTAQFGNKMLFSAGGTDIFLVKYASGGLPAWSCRIGSADDDYVQKIIADEEGNVILAGSFYGTTQIGQDQYASYGSQDIFIAKFNSGGDFIWSYRAGGLMADYVTGLTIDADQNLVIAGYFYEGIYFGDSTFLASGSSDIYMAKFDKDGQLLWAATAGGSSSDQVRSVSCDPDGNLVLTGSFYYDITLGDTTLSTVNPVGVVIARYRPNGQLDMAFQLDGTYLTPEVYVTSCTDGDFYISGNFSEQVIFGNKTFDAGEFNQDVFIAKYDASFDLEWAKHGYGRASDQVIGIATDSLNNLYLTGHYLDTIHFDMLTLDYTLCCGSLEIFIVKCNEAGDVIWGEQISGTRANIQSVAMNGQDELLLSGLFSEEILMGDLSLSNFDGFQNYVTCLKTEIYAAVGQDSKINRLKVFPNPTRDKIQFAGPGQHKPVIYLIYSENGLLALSGEAIEGDNISVSSLPAGQYLLRLIDTEESSWGSCLLIKQ